MSVLPAPTLDMVHTALQLPLPGRAAQQTMAPRPRPGDLVGLPDYCPHEGAVMLLVYERCGNLIMPFTRRTDKVQVHRGQISFPGGSREPHDIDLAHTALRETGEELGVTEEVVEVLGALTPLYIASTQFCVHPYVGHAAQLGPFQSDPREVAEVIEVSLEQLLDPLTRQEEDQIRDGQPFRIPSYRVAEHRIWGATAMMLAEFLALLQSARAGTLSGL